MGAQDMKLAVVVSLKDELTSGLKRMGDSVNRFAKDLTGAWGQAHMQTVSFGTALNNLGSMGVRALGRLGRAVGEVAARLFEAGKYALLFGGGIAVALGTASIKAAMNLESLFAKMTVAIKDPQAARAMFEWAKEFAKTTPFEMPSVVDATVRLEMYGLAAKQWMPLVGNMAGAMNKDVTEAVEAVADALSGSGIERLKESFGITGVQLIEAGAHPAAAGGIAATTRDDLDALREALEKVMASRFAGGMEKMMKTSAGALSNFKDSITMLLATIGETMLPMFNAALTVLQNFFVGLQGGGQAAAIGESFGKMIAWIVENLSKLIAWFQANQNVIGQWFRYLVDWAKYAVDWIRGNFGSITVTILKALAPVIDTFFDIAGFLVRFKAGFMALGEAIGIAFVNGTVVILTTVRLLVDVLDNLAIAADKVVEAFSGGTKHIDTSGIDAARKKLDEMNQAQFESIAGGGIKRVMDTWQKGQEEGLAIEQMRVDTAAKLYSFGAGAIRAQRESRAGGAGALTAPTAPTAAFVPWGQATVNMTVNVDARGAQDPSAVRAAARGGTEEAWAAQERAMRNFSGKQGGWGGAAMPAG